MSTINEEFYIKKSGNYWYVIRINSDGIHEIVNWNVNYRTMKQAMTRYKDGISIIRITDYCTGGAQWKRVFTHKKPPLLYIPEGSIV
jgi:hypothetical protein